MLNVEQWAELRRLHFIERVVIRELARRFGLSRKTVRRSLRSVDPPRYSRAPAPSKLDPFKDEIHRLLRRDPRLPIVSSSSCGAWGALRVPLVIVDEVGYVPFDPQAAN